jgi:hypothetical protein
MTQRQGTKISAAPQIIWGILAFLVGAAAFKVAALMSQAYTDADNRAVPFLVVCIICVVVAAVFGFVSVITAVDRKSRQSIAARRALHPDEPWLWAEEWQQGCIKAIAGGSVAAALIVFAAVWNAVVIGVAVLCFQREDLNRVPLWITLAVFALAGLFLVGLAVYFAVQGRKFDRGVFQMRRVPGILGGSLEGTVQLPRQLSPDVEVNIELTCESISGTGRNSMTRCLFQTSTSRRAGAGQLPVLFEIPPDLPPSDNPDHRGTTRIHWWLKTKASVSGVDYADVFEVPVFALSNYHSIAEGIVDTSEPVSPPPKARSKIIESSDSRMEVALQGVQYWGCGLVTALLFPLIAFPAGFAFEGGARLGIHIAGLLLGVSTLALLCTSFLVTPARIEIDREGLRIYHGKGPLRRTRTVPLQDVAQFEYVSSGDPPAQRIEVHTQDGRSYRVSEDLSGSEETKWLTIELSRAVQRYRG